MGVQVQILFEDPPQLEFGVVDEVFDDQQGSQPLVRLTSGTVGAVRISLPPWGNEFPLSLFPTCMECTLKH